MKPIRLNDYRAATVELSRRESAVERRARLRVQDVLTGFAWGASTVFLAVCGWWLLGVFP